MSEDKRAGESLQAASAKPRRLLGDVALAAIEVGLGSTMSPIPARGQSRFELWIFPDSAHQQDDLFAERVPESQL